MNAQPVNRLCAKALLLAGATLFSTVLATPTLAQDRALGLIVQNNINAMLVDPNPEYAGVPIEGSNGLKADTAVTRYRTGRVQPLMSFSGATNVGSTGGANTSGAAPAPNNGPR